MPRTPEQIRIHDHYLNIEVELARLADAASDAVDLASILTDGPGVPYVLWHDAVQDMPKAIRKIENRLEKVKKLWSER